MTDTMPSEVTPGDDWVPYKEVPDGVIYSPEVGRELHYRPPTTLTADVKENMNLIGFAGYRGSGKDQAAELFLVNGYSPLKMAGGLKIMLRALLDFRGCPHDHIERMIEGDKKEEPTYYLGGKSPRYAMQTLGTEWGRDTLSQTLWTEAVSDHIRTMNTNTIITDVRFPNEVDLIHSLGGVVIRIKRDEVQPVGAVHASEKYIGELDVDYIVENNKTINDLYAATSVACTVLQTARTLKNADEGRVFI